MDHYNWEKHFPNDFIDLNEVGPNHPHFISRRNRINQEYENNAHISQSFPKDKHSYIPKWQREFQSFDNRRIPREASTFRIPYDWNMPLKTEPCHTRRNNTEIYSSYAFPHNLRDKVKPQYYLPHKSKYEMDHYSNKHNSRRSHPDFHRNHRYFYGNHFYTQDALDRKSDLPVMQSYNHSNLPPAVWENGNFQMAGTQFFNQNASFNKLQNCKSTQHATDCDRINCSTGTNAKEAFTTDLKKYSSSDELAMSITSSSILTNDITNSSFTMVEFSPATNEAINSIEQEISTTEKEVSKELENTLSCMDETGLSVYYLQNLYPSLGVENSIPNLSFNEQLVSTDRTRENLFQEVLEDKESDQIINNNIYFDRQIGNQCNESPRASRTILEECSKTSTEEIKKLESNLNETDNNICRSTPEKADKNAELANCIAYNSFNSLQNSNDFIISSDGRCSTDLVKDITTEVKDMYEVVTAEQDMSLEISNSSPRNLDVNNFKGEWDCNENMPISLEMAWNLLLDSNIPSNQVEASVTHIEDPMTEESTQTGLPCDELSTLIDTPACQVDSNFESDGFKMQHLKHKSKCKKKRQSKISSFASDAMLTRVLDPEELLNPTENCFSPLNNSVFDELSDIKYHNDEFKLESSELPEESAGKNSIISSRRKVVKRRRKSKKNLNYSIETTSIQESSGSNFMYSNILDSKISLNQIETSLSSITNYVLDEPMDIMLDNEKLEFHNLKYPVVTGLYSGKKSTSRRTRAPRQKNVKNCRLQSTIVDPFLSSASVSNLSLDLLEDMFEPNSPSDDEKKSSVSVRSRNKGRVNSAKKIKKFSRKESKVSIVQKYAKPISIHDRPDSFPNESRSRDDDFVKIDNLRQVLKEFYTAKVEKKDACTQFEEKDLSPLIRNKCDAETQWDLSDVSWSEFPVKCEQAEDSKSPQFPNCTENRQLRGDVATHKETIRGKQKIHWNLRTRQTSCFQNKQHGNTRQTSCSQNKQHGNTSRTNQSTPCFQSEELDQEGFANSGIQEEDDKLKPLKNLIVKISPLKSENIPHNKEAFDNGKKSFRHVKVKEEENSLNMRTGERRCKKLPQKVCCRKQQQSKSVKFEAPTAEKNLNKNISNARNTKISDCKSRRYSLRKRKCNKIDLT